MDEQTKKDLFEDLGAIKAQLASIQKESQGQTKRIDKIDDRLRKQEMKTYGIPAGIALIVSTSIDAIKKGIAG